MIKSLKWKINITFFLDGMTLQFSAYLQKKIDFDKNHAASMKNLRYHKHSVQVPKITTMALSMLLFYPSLLNKFYYLVKHVIHRGSQLYFFYIKVFQSQQILWFFIKNKSNIDSSFSRNKFNQPQKSIKKFCCCLQTAVLFFCYNH